MANVEKLEYRLQLICGYKIKFYANNLKYRVTAKISKTMSKIIDKKAMDWSEAQLLKEILLKRMMRMNFTMQSKNLMIRHVTVTPSTKPCLIYSTKNMK